MYKVLLFSFVCIHGLINWAQTGNTWTKKASFGGLKREKAVSFSVGEYGYIGCGVDTAEATHNDLWQYNPELDTWTQMASIPGSERRNAVAFAVDGKAYVGTGFSHDDGTVGVKLKDFWEYDPTGNSWTAKADYPGGGDTGIYSATAFSALGKGYVACGKIGSDAYIPEMWEYNPITDSWVERTPFPGGDRYQLVSFSLENKGYVGLGTDHDVFRKDFYEYDPSTNTWEILDDFPGTERAKGSAFSIGIKGFVIFGTDGGHKDELWEYNYYSQSWTIRAPFPGGGRSYGAAFAIGNKGYAGIGKESDGKKSSFYEYAPTGPLGINEQESIKFGLYPNPVTETANLVLPEKLDQGIYTVTNLDGKIVMQEAFNSSSFQVSRNNLPAGYYQLTISDHNQIPVGVKKIVIL